MDTDEAERLRTDERERQQQELSRQSSERVRVAAEQARVVAENGRRAAATELCETVATLTSLLDRMEAVEEMRRAARNNDSR